MSTASSSRRAAATSRSAQSPESFDSLHARDAAAEILQSYEKLSWFSFQRCETIMQTRLHFQRVVAGIESDDEKDIKWKEDFTRHPKQGGDDSKSGRKGKERVSLGGGGNGEKESSASRSKSRVSEMSNVGDSGEHAEKDS